MIFRVFVLSLLLGLAAPSLSLASSSSIHPSSASLGQDQSYEVVKKKKPLRGFFRRLFKKKDSKNPRTLFGFEPFTVVGIGLLAAGFFWIGLMPLGLLSILIGFVRYRIFPDAFKGKKLSPIVLIMSLVVPAYVFLVNLIFKGNVGE